MRIGVTKQPYHVKHANYAVFASGTTSDVWFDDDENAWEVRESDGEQTGKTEAYDS